MTDDQIIEQMSQAILEAVGGKKGWGALSESTQYDDDQSKPYWRNAGYSALMAYRHATQDDGK